MRHRLAQLHDSGAADGDLVTYDAASGLWTPQAPPGGGGSAHVIEDEGVDLTARSQLNFTGAGVTVTDDAANDRTIVTIPGGGGGGGGGPVWTQVVDEPTPTVADFTTVDTTWSDNTYLQLATTSNAWRTARYNGADLPVGSQVYIVAEVEFEVQADFTAAGEYMRFGWRPSTATTAAEDGYALNLAGDGALRYYLSTSFVSCGTVSVATGWHTLRIVAYRGTGYAYYDGVKVGTLALSTYAHGGTAGRISIWGYGAWTGRFRNLKAWTGEPYLP